MLKIELEILKKLNDNPMCPEDIKKQFPKEDQGKIIYYIEKLEDGHLIEELTEKEKEAIDQGFHYNSISGDTGNFINEYILTDIGIEFLEGLAEENMKFYAPFIFSGICSILSIAISIVAIVLNLS